MGLLGRRASDVFMGIAVLHKNNLNLKHLIANKSLQGKIIFSLIRILTKSLVTFGRWDAAKDAICQYYGGLVKNLIFRGWGVTKKQDIGRNYLKTLGTWTV